MDHAVNFAKVMVVGNYDESATEITIGAGQGGRLPDTPFNAVWWNASDFPDPADDLEVEIVRVTDNTDDVLTVTRAQEGRAARSHNLAGKTYHMLAGLTALAWTTMLGDVFGSGTAVLIDSLSETIELRQSVTKGLAITGGSTIIEDTTSVDIGDPTGNNNSSFMSISDQNQRVSFIGLDIATDRTASATVAVGTLVAKLAIRDGSGTIIGYLPIYGSIT
jgi:hypothetical protein